MGASALRPPVNRFVGAREVAELLGTDRANVMAKVRSGEIPTPVFIGPRTPVWPDYMLDEILNPRVPASPTLLTSITVPCNHPKRDEPTCLYRHWNADGELLYVGISLSSIDRLAAHRSGSPWFREIARIDIEWHSDRLSAMRAERIAIQSESPKYNQRMMAR